MSKNRNSLSFASGIVVTVLLAVLGQFLSGLVPYNLISGGVFAMLVGMALHPVLKNILSSFSGIDFVAKKLLKLSIILMGATLSLGQVYSVGKVSLIVMVFTLATAFGFGNLIGKWFGMNWKLANLISAGTGICGGSAIAAISPTIEAEDEDIAYALSATFIFDILMVIAFPICAAWMNMSDLGFGLWAGTAINDTSSVVAAGYAYSEMAGNYAVIVKLTRTLSIIPTVLIFAFIHQRLVQKNQSQTLGQNQSVSIASIFPWFILFFLVMVGFRTAGWISDDLSQSLSTISQFAMVMSLGAIGLRTDFKKVAKSGFKPMIHGFIISSLVVIVSLVVQRFLGQI